MNIDNKENKILKIEKIPNRSFKKILSVYLKLAHFHLNRYFFSTNRGFKSRFMRVFLPITLILANFTVLIFSFFKKKSAISAIFSLFSLFCKLSEKNFKDLRIIFKNFLSLILKNFSRRASVFRLLKNYLFSFESIMEKPLSLNFFPYNSLFLFFNFYILEKILNSNKKSDEKISEDEILLISTIENIRFYDIVIFEIVLSFFSFFTIAFSTFVFGSLPFFYSMKKINPLPVQVPSVYFFISFIRESIEILLHSLRSMITLISFGSPFYSFTWLSYICLIKQQTLNASSNHVAGAKIISIILKISIILELFLFAYKTFKKILKRTSERENFY
jgi:hypothetical protein